jgi:hypothetical protein
MKFLRTLFASLMVGTAAKAAEPSNTKNPADMMREMRIMWLKTIPEKGSFKSETEVVAVLMDWPLGENIATILASSGGDASLYTTSTFGVLGGIGHEQVRKASIDFVACAQHYLDITQPSPDYAYPDNQTLRIYMVTPSGVRRVSFPMSDIEKKDSPARTFFYYGQEVLTQLRQITPNQK